MELVLLGNFAPRYLLFSMSFFRKDCLGPPLAEQHRKARGKASNYASRYHTSLIKSILPLQVTKLKMIPGGEGEENRALNWYDNPLKDKFSLCPPFLLTGFFISIQ
jgi:hypothetical protein